MGGWGGNFPPPLWPPMVVILKKNQFYKFPCLVPLGRQVEHRQPAVALPAGLGSYIIKTRIPTKLFRFFKEIFKTSIYQEFGRADVVHLRGVEEEGALGLP